MSNTEKELTMNFLELVFYHNKWSILVAYITLSSLYIKNFLHI